MGRGLSSLQKDILKVLETYPRGPSEDGVYSEELARPRDILDGLGFERTLMYITGMANIRDILPFPRVPRWAKF